MDVKSQEPAPAPKRRETVLAVLVAALVAFGLAVLAGLDAGTWARCTLAAAASWWLARRLGLGQLGALLAALSFAGSAAVVSGSPPGRAGQLDAGLFELGLLLVVVALVTGWRSAPRSPWMTALSVPAVALLLLAVVRLLGAPWLAVVPDALGAPGRTHGYLGMGGSAAFEASAAVWVPLPTLALALAGALSPAGRLRGRDAVAALGFGAYLAGVTGALPLGPTALPAALFLALLAGDGLEAAAPAARAVAALTVIPLALATTWIDAELLDQAPIPGDPPDELVVFTEPPAPHYAGARGVLHLAGEVHAPVAAHAVDATLEGRQGDGEFRPADLAPLEVQGERAQDGTLRFRTVELELRSLTNGTWRWSVAVLGESGERLGRRDSASFAVRHTPVLSPLVLLVLAGIAATGLTKLVGRPGTITVAVGLVVLAGLQVVDFALLL